MAKEAVEVLHLEPDESTRVLLEREVRKSGLRYHGFSNLQDFSSVVLAKRPELVVMNTMVRSYGLPKPAGDVASELKNIHPTTKIVFYSSDDVAAEDLARLHNSQFYCFGVSSPRDVVRGMLTLLEDRK